MRTTLSVDEDVLERARRVAARLGVSFKAVINESLRRGLEFVEKPRPIKRYRTQAHDMGLRRGMNLDNIEELLSQIEGERFK